MAYAIVILGVGAGSFANTLLTGSLQTIARELHTSVALVSWMQVAPFLLFAIGLPICGKLCDLVGTRRVYLAGLAVAACGNALLSIVPNVGLAIACRTLAQVGTAATMPGGFKIVSALFEGSDRTRRIGAYNAATAMSPVLGVGLGAPLIAALGWRVPFVLQSVLLVVALAAATRFLPDTPRAPRVRFDLAGAALLAAGVGSSLFVVNRARTWGADHPVIVLLAIAGPSLLYALSRVERRIDEPLMPLQYLALPDFRRLLAASGFNNIAYFGTTIAAPIAMTRVFGLSETAALYVVMLRPLAWAGGAALAPRLTLQFGHREAQVGANLLQVASVGGAGAAVGGHWLLALILCLALHGFASGIAQVAVMSTVASTVDVRDAGVGNGVMQMVSMIGTATGTALASVVVADALGARSFVFVMIGAAAICGVVVVFSARLGHEQRARRRGKGGSRLASPSGARGIDRLQRGAAPRRVDTGNQARTCAGERSTTVQHGRPLLGDDDRCGREHAEARSEGAAEQTEHR